MHNLSKLPNFKAILFSFIAILSIRISEAQITWNQIGADLIGEAGGDNFGDAISLNGDGNIVAIGAPMNDDAGADAGHVRVFEYSAGSWTQLGSDIDAEAAGDNGGRATYYQHHDWVSLNDAGDIVAIGGLYNDGGAYNGGHVRVYQYDSGSWNKLGQDIDGENANMLCGASVALNANGDIVAFGCTYDNGLVRAYQYNSGTSTWVKVGPDMVGIQNNAAFGGSVEINDIGDIIAAGGKYYSSGKGYVGAYQYDTTNDDWVPLGGFIIGQNTNDRAGQDLALNGNGSVFAVGSPFHDTTNYDEGQTRVFRYNSGSWTQLGSDIYGEAQEDDSAWNVALNEEGNIVAVGSYKNDDGGSNAGKVRMFQYDYDADAWVQLGPDVVGQNSNEKLGFAVALSDDGHIMAAGGNYGTGVVRIFSVEGITTANPTSEPSSSPSNPTSNPTLSPSKLPTSNPTIDPTTKPSISPTASTLSPSNNPTVSPTESTANPSSSPRVEPTSNPTNSR